jgi:hypothetical protein
MKEFLAKGTSTNFKRVPAESGFMWSDFINLWPPQTSPQIKAQGVGASLRGAKLAVTAHVDYVQQYLADHAPLKAIIRGHQDQSFGVKMLFAPGQAFNSNSFDVGAYPWGPYHWKYIVAADYQTPQGDIPMSKYFPVWTLSSAAEGQGLPYDAFGRITLAEGYEQWTMQIHEYELPADRNNKMLHLHVSPDGSRLECTWEAPGVEKPVFSAELKLRLGINRYCGFLVSKTSTNSTRALSSCYCNNT